jgi:hypothetical protein
MKWGPGLDKALSVMLSCVISTKSVGDQLWCKVIGPPSSGKSTLCEAISVNKKYVLAKSRITGFHSGYKSDKAGTKDHSLLALVQDKTLVTKDGDTLLSHPNLQQILAEARDIYDRTSRAHYRTGMERDYEDVAMTWILCGTSGLRALDSSELGARFLDCTIMDEIDDEEEDDILLRVAHRSERNVSTQSNGKMETADDPAMVHAKQLTGGYVGYLRSNAAQLLAQVQMDEGALRRCMSLGKFVAYMRARPSKKQEELAEREFAARLVSQMVRLAKCLAAVLGKRKVDNAVLQRVASVALDTAKGRTLNLCRHLYNVGTQGAETRQLALWTNESEQSERLLLRFLKKLGAVDLFEPRGRGNIRCRPRWRLAPRLQRLYATILGQASDVTLHVNMEPTDDTTTAAQED